MDSGDKKDTLKKHQIDDIYRSDDVPFIDVSKGISKRLVQYGISLFLVLFILSFIIKIPREIHLEFELKGGLNETIYQYPEIIYIEVFYVQANDSIHTGDSLVNITSPKIVKYIEAYEEWQGKLELYKNGKNLANKQAISLLNTRVSGFQSEITKVEIEKKLAISAGRKETENLILQLENTRKQHQRNIELHEGNVISDLELEGSLKSLQVAEQNLISTKEKYALRVAEIESRLQKLTNSYNETEVELIKIIAEFAYDLKDVTNNLKLARKKIELNYGPFIINGSSITLLSPVNGVVSLKTETEYETNSGEILLRIRTDSTGYFAYASAGPKDIGHISLNTKAILKYKSFPHYYYGTMKATVQSISPSPAEHGNFPVRLNITDTGKLEKKVTKGMTGTASFVVEEKSVFDFILRGFLRTITIE
jgi:multidrug efflux pump subunit AcrA (membrane-fusion protein)